jgi:dephospho-CoA kinase
MEQHEEKLVIGIAGEIASGKDTVTRYYVKKHGASMYRFSDVIRDILKRLHLEENRKNLADASLMLRKTFGEDVFSRAVAEETMADANTLVIIDGVRRVTDISGVQNLPGFRLLYIAADPKKRYERMSTRNQNADDGTKTFEEFLCDNELESELQIRELKTKADWVIDNNGTLDELYMNADLFLEKAKEPGKKNWAWGSVWKAE